MSSRNRPIVDGLINTMQRKLEPVKVFSALEKMNKDLDEAWSGLFEGPLPAVSGEKLILTNTPAENFPDFIAMTNEENLFVEDQFFQGERIKLELTYEADSVVSDTVGVIQVPDNEKLLVGHDFQHDGDDWVGAGIGLVINGVDKELTVLRRISGLVETLFKIDDKGIVIIGTVPVTGDADQNELVMKNDHYIFGANSTNNGVVRIVAVDGDDIVRLGEDAQSNGKGHVSVPIKFADDLPPGSNIQNGTIAIDKTTNRLVYYSNGNRYRIAIGTSF